MSTLLPDPSDEDDRTVIRAPSRAGSAGADAAAATPARPASEHGNALPMGTQLGEFELTQVLGEGGFGIVYLAQDHSLQRRVALKEYMPSSLAARTGSTQVSVKSERHRETFELGLKSFVNEARLLAQFDHPSLVKVYRFWEANGTAYMVMPFYEGITLKDKLRELGGPPDEAWLLALLAPLTEALAVIHAEQCYHRDIAPDNIILLAGSGKPLLLDFGAARRVIGDMTHALTVILKPGYAPLEQYAEVPSMKQGPWTDVYALAAVVYYAITGKTPPAAVGRMMSDQYQPLAECARGRYSERFLLAIDRALRVLPEARTASVGDLRLDLDLDALDVADNDTRPVSFLDSTQLGAAPSRPAPLSSTRSTPSTATRKAQPQTGAAPVRRRGLWLGAGAAVLVIGGIGAFLALTPSSRPDAPASTPSSPSAQPAATATAPEPPLAATTPVAPAVAPVVQAPPPPPPPFSVSSEFDHIVQAASPGFAVQATPVKPQLRIGQDRLAFKVSSAQAGHVYVLLEGPDGSLILLFPNSVSSQNRIRAGQTLSLPQASWPLDTSDPPGPEKFLVMVSRSPRDFSGLSTTRDGWFTVLPTGDAAAKLAAGFSGTGSVFAGRATCSEPGCDAYGAQRFSIDVTR